MKNALVLAGLTLIASTAHAEPWVTYDGPVTVMHVEGTLAEMAAQQGAFTKASPAGTKFIDAFSGEVSGYISASSLLKKIPGARVLSNWIYKILVRDPLVRSIPKPEREAYAAYAKAMGYSEDQLLDGVVLTDSSLVMQEFLQKIGVFPRIHHFACSSIFWDTRAGDTTYYARNLDSEEIGLWDKSQVVIHSVPKDGLASVSMGVMGYPTIGITGFNEAGLSLDLHQLNEWGTSSHGMPVLLIADRILREAHSIDEAVVIVKSYKKRAGTWAYVLSKDGEKAVIETTSRDFFVYRSRDSFFYVGSHGHGEDLKRDEAFFLTSDMLDSLERIDRMETYGRQFASEHDASSALMGELIADRPRVAAGTVARLDAAESVVIDAKNHRLWVGTGDMRIAPNQGRYVGFEWGDLRSDARPRALGGFTVASAHSPLDQRLRGLLREVQVAETLGQDDHLVDLLTEFTGLVKASPVMERGSWSGLYLYIGTALMRMKAHGADLAELDSLLDLALSDSDLNGDARWIRYRRELGLLYKARIADLRGNRADALGRYAALLDGPLEPNLKKAAQEGLKNAYTIDDAAGIDISYSMIDLVL